MDICRNFGNKGCPIDINTPIPGHHSKTEEEFPICPEIKELNKICRNCKLFYPKECPYCNGTDIKEHITGAEFKGKEIITNSSFICGNCGEEFLGLTYIITKKHVFK